MKFLVPTMAAMALCVSGAAWAQTASIDTSPSTPQDTRRIDQAQAPPNGQNGTAAAAGPSNLGTSNWRTSDGFNADPNNPNGAPGPSTVGTSPAR